MSIESTTGVAGTSPAKSEEQTGTASGGGGQSDPVTQVHADYSGMETVLRPLEKDYWGILTMDEDKRNIKSDVEGLEKFISSYNAFAKILADYFVILENDIQSLRSVVDKWYSMDTDLYNALEYAGDIEAAEAVYTAMGGDSEISE